MSHVSDVLCHSLLLLAKFKFETTSRYPLFDSDEIRIIQLFNGFTSLNYIHIIVTDKKVKIVIDNKSL